MSDVFISYSRRNSKFARQVIDHLNRANKDSWVDWGGIPLTAPNWWSEIKAGIENADSFIFIMSPDSMASVVCNMELDYALELRKRIIPIVHQDIESREAFASIADFEPDEAMQQRLEGKDPLIIARDNWQRISHINWIFFRENDDFDTAFEKLITTVETDLEYVKAHTHYLTRAQEWQRENRRSDLLLFGSEIDRAEDWLEQAESYAQIQAEGKVDVVNPLAQDLHYEYIQTSRKEEQRRRRITLTTRASIAVLILVAIVAGIISFNAIGNSNAAATDVAEANSANTKSAILRQEAENYANSIQLAARGQDIYNNGQNQSLGLAFAYQASLIDTAPQTQRILSELAYAPGERYRFEGHTGLVTSVAFSPDGNSIISGSDDGTLILWDVASGQILQRFEGHSDWVRSVAFSPDGNSIISGSDDHQLILWDVTSGQILRHFEGHSAGVNSVAFSPDGKNVLSGYADSTLILWDVASGQILRHFEGHSNWVRSVAFSPDGNSIISSACSEADFYGFCFKESELILWDVTNGQILRRFEGHSAGVNSVAFSPDGNSIISGSADSTLILWDVASGQILRRFEGHPSWVLSVAFSPDGNSIISGSADTTLILWDVASGQILHRFEKHSDWVLSAAFSPDGNSIISGSYQELFLWNVTNGQILRRFKGHSAGVNSVAFSPDGRTVLSGSHDRTLILWDADTGQELRQFKGHSNKVTSVAFSPDGQTVLSGSDDRTLILWDADTGQELRQFKGHSDKVTSVAFSPDGQTVLSGSLDKTLILWDVASGQILRRFEGHSSRVNSVAFSPDGKTIISGSFRKLFLWDVASGQILQRFEGHIGEVTSVAFSPDGNSIISGSFQELFLWDVANGQILHRFEGYTGEVNSVAFSPDGKTILTGSEDSTLVLWDVASGQILRRSKGHSNWWVRSVAFSPDGQRIVSGSDDGTLILWRNDSLEQLQAWVRENRYLPELSCEQRATYSLTPCVDGTAPATATFVPTQTAFPTAIIPIWTPISSPTAGD